MSICNSSVTNLPDLHVAIELDQDQNLHNQEPDNIEVTEEPRREACDSRVISIRDKLEQAQRDDDITTWGKLCIYRIPFYLQENDNKSYVPQTVSIGPYHHEDERLQSMERHKWRAVNRMLNRTEQNIEMYIDAIGELEEKARECYQGDIGLSIDEFTERLVLDGCFVLELFRGNVEGFRVLGYARNDPIFARRGFILTIIYDLLLLENQLPLFILNKLLELQLGQVNQTSVVVNLAVRFFEPLYKTITSIAKGYQSELIMNQLDSLDDIGDLHFLDLFRHILLKLSMTPLPTFRQRRSSWLANGLYQPVHCAKKLCYAGVKFRKKETDRVWDIQFRNGYLEIPKLIIHDGTKSLLLNLVAFEQCHIKSSKKLTFYVMFMKNLIQSHEDVSFLQDYGIIEHDLGSDSDVVDFFNRLCQQLILETDHNYLSEVSDELNRFYKRKAYMVILHIRYLKPLGEKYFNNPWSYCSFIAAVVLLALTITQTFFTVYAFYNPPS